MHLVLLGEILEGIGIAPVLGKQLLGAHYAKPIRGRIIALHLVLYRLVKLAVPRRRAGEEHARHRQLVFRNAARLAREFLHLADAAFAAMIGENRPVPAAELALETRQVIG